MVRGELFANLWPTNALVRIDLATGAVTGWIHLGALLDPAERTGEEDVVNGIAWDEATQRLFVTGKNWPRLFELELIPPY
jgi:glutamine cyclotransferase